MKEPETITAAGGGRPLLEALRAAQRQDGRLTNAALKSLAVEYTISLSRLTGIATSYPEFVLEPEADELRPVSDSVDLPGFLAASAAGAATVVEAASLGTRFAAPAMTLAEYEASSGLKALKRVKTENQPERFFSEIVLGGVTRKPAAWQQVQISPEAPVIMANAHAGDPSAAQARLLIEKDGYAVIEGMFIAAMVTGARQGYIYLDPESAATAQRLTDIAREMREYTGIDFTAEAITGPFSLVGSEDSAVAGSIGRDRPVPVPRDPAIRGIVAKPVLVDSAECFAAVAASLAAARPVTTRLYQVSGAVSNGGIFEGEPDLSISDILAKSGAGGAAAVLIGGLSGGFAAGSSAFARPLIDFERTDSPRYRTLHVFRDSSELLQASTEMAVYNGRYLCGYCIPCRIGAVRMGELLVGAAADAAALPAALLKELAQTVEKAGLCQAGKGAAGMVFSALETVENKTGND